MYLIIIAAGILPAFLLWGYIWKMDKKKEPTPLLVKATCYGVLICFPVALVESMISSVLFDSGGPSTIIGTTADAFMVAAIPEETFKLLALRWILKNNPYFDEHFDGIVYAVCVGLGFAAIENVFYLFGNEEWITTAIARSLLAVPGHYAFAILMGYYYSVYHFVDDSPKVAICILAVPVLAHGIYDAFAMSGIINEIVALASFIALVVFCIKMHRVALKKVVALIEKDAKTAGNIKATHIS